MIFLIMSADQEKEQGYGRSPTMKLSVEEQRRILMETIKEKPWLRELLDESLEKLEADTNSLQSF